VGCQFSSYMKLTCTSRFRGDQSKRHMTKAQYLIKWFQRWEGGRILRITYISSQYKYSLNE
jgi:hypothetical protein